MVVVALVQGLVLDYPPVMLCLVSSRFYIYRIWQRTSLVRETHDVRSSHSVSRSVYATVLPVSPSKLLHPMLITHRL